MYSIVTYYGNNHLGILLGYFWVERSNDHDQRLKDRNPGSYFSNTSFAAMLMCDN